MARLNRKQWLVLGFLALAAVCVAVTLVWLLNPDRRQRVALGRAHQFEKAGNDPAAVIEYSKALGIKSRRPAPAFEYYLFGQLLERTHDVSSAQDKYRACANLDSRNVPARKRLAVYYYADARVSIMQRLMDPDKVEKLASLESVAKELISLRPNESEGYIWLARALALRGDAQKAVEPLDEFVRIVPDDMTAVAEKGRILLASNKPEDKALAKSVVEEALAAHPDDAALLLVQAGSAEAEGRLQDQENALRRIVASNAENREALLQLGMLCWRTRRWEEAESHLITAAKLHAGNAEPHLALARFYVERGKLAEALASADNALAINTTDVGALAQKARIQIQLSDLDGAEQTIGQLKTNARALPVMLLLQGMAAAIAKDPNTAAAKFREAISRTSDGKYPEASYLLGITLRQEGQPGAAEEEFQKAALSPEWRDRASLSLAETYLMERKMANALNLVAQIRSSRRSLPAGVRDPMDASLNIVVGQAKLMQDNIAEAETALRAAVNSAEDNSDRVSSSLWLARVLAVKASREPAEAESRKQAIGEAKVLLDEAGKIAANNLEIVALQNEIAKMGGAAVDPGALGQTPQGALIIVASLTRELKLDDLGKAQSEQVEKLCEAHPNSALLEAASGDYYMTLSGSLKLKTAALTGDDAAAATAAQQAALQKALAHARVAHGIDRENSSNVIRLFSVMRELKMEADTAELLKDLNAKPAMQWLSLALKAVARSEAATPVAQADAEALLKEALKLNSQDWRVHFWLARVYAQMPNQAAAAEREFAEALRLSPTSTAARNAFLGFLEEQKNFVRLQQEIDQALFVTPDDQNLIRLSARWFEHSGQFDRAAERWARIVALNPNDLMVRIGFSDLLRRAGHPQQAAAAAEEALKIDPKNSQAQRALILAHLASGDRAKSRELLRQALVENPSDATLSAVIRDVIASSTLAEAEQELKALVEQNQNDPTTRLFLAEFYESQGKLENAGEAYQAALALRQGYAPAEIGLIRIQIALATAAGEQDPRRQQLIDDASKRVAAARTAYPKNVAVRQMEADLLMLKQDAAGAEKVLQETAKEFPGEGNAQLAYVRFLYQQGRYPEAREQLKKVTDSNPNNAEAKVALAEIYREENRLSEALRVCNDALALDPKNVAALQAAVRVAAAGRRYAEANDFQARIVNLQPYNYVALATLTQGLIAQNHLPQALQVARVAYSRNPGSIIFLQEFFRLLVMNERLPEAEKVAADFVREHPEEDTARLMLADAQYRGRRPGDAAATLGQAEAVAKDQTAFSQRAAELCRDRADYERALRFALKFQGLLPESISTIDLVTRIHRAANQPDRAIAAAVDAARQHPDSGEFMTLAIREYMMSKKPDEAIALCRDFVSRNPKEIPAAIHLVQLLVETRRNDEALAEINRILAPGAENLSEPVLVALTRNLVFLKQYDMAKPLAEQVCRLQPTSGQAWFSYASIMELQGVPNAEKIKFYREALAKPLRGRDRIMHMVNNYAYALAIEAVAPGTPNEQREKMLVEAEERISAVLGDLDSAMANLLDTLGWVQFLANKQTALENLARATRKPDATPEMRYHYAMACARWGDVDEAKRVVRRASEESPENKTWIDDVNMEVTRRQEKQP